MIALSSVRGFGMKSEEGYQDDGRNTFENLSRGVFEQLMSSKLRCI